MKTAFLVAQCLTYVGLGVIFSAEDQWKRGVAQLLLAVVQFLLFS